jgi:uncharacterized alkaline shock family protein YloU
MMSRASGQDRPQAEIVISPQVIAAIGAHAAATTPGVTRLETSVTGLLADLGRAARHRIAGISPAPVTGTTGTMAGGQPVIRVEIAVSGDEPAVRTAAAVQRSVTSAVTAGTGLTVAGVTIAILDIDLDTGPGGASPQRPGPADGTVGQDRQESPPGTNVPSGPVGSRAEVAAAVLAGIRAVPGLRPASLVRPDRARWMPWDPAILAVGLTDSHVSVQLAATRLPLPPLLELAADAVCEATRRTAWAGLPCRLAVTALDAGAFGSPSPPGEPVTFSAARP